MTNEAEILQAMLDEIAEQGWRRWNLASFDLDGQYRPAEIYEIVPSKRCLITKLGRHLDREMLKPVDQRPDDASRKDILFELLMARFDAMQPFKPGLQRIAREMVADPLMLLSSLCNLDRMASWCVGLAEPNASGLRKQLIKKGVVVSYTRGFSVWLHDDSGDSAKTMAELDKRLSHLDLIERYWPKRRQRRQQPEAGAA